MEACFQYLPIRVSPAKQLFCVSLRKCEQPDVLTHGIYVLTSFTKILHFVSKISRQLSVYAVAATQQLLVHCVMELRVSMIFSFKLGCRIFVVCGHNSLLLDHARGDLCTIMRRLILLLVWNYPSLSTGILSYPTLNILVIFRHEIFPFSMTL